MAIVWILIGAVLVVLGTMFAAQNPRSADLFFFGYTLAGVPLWVLVIMPALAGLLLGFLIDAPGRIRAALTNRRLSMRIQERERTVGELQRRVAELERDLAIARAQPPPVVVADTHRPRDAVEVPQARAEPDRTRRTDSRAADLDVA